MISVSNRCDHVGAKRGGLVHRFRDYNGCVDSWPIAPWSLQGGYGMLVTAGRPCGRADRPSRLSDTAL